MISFLDGIPWEIPVLGLRDVPSSSLLREQGYIGNLRHSQISLEA